MITGIHHFSIIASSEASIAFYTSLGITEYKRIERGYDTVVLMEGYGVGLEIFIDASHAPSSSEPLGLRYLSLKVDDIEKTMKELGVDGKIQTDWNGKRYVMITDPDGNDVQLIEDLK